MHVLQSWSLKSQLVTINSFHNRNGDHSYLPQADSWHGHGMDGNCIHSVYPHVPRNLFPERHSVTTLWAATVKWPRNKIPLEYLLDNWISAENTHANIFLLAIVDYTDEDDVTKTDCKKDTGASKVTMETTATPRVFYLNMRTNTPCLTVQKWTRSHLFIVHGVGHVDTWQPLY